MSVARQPPSLDNWESEYIALIHKHSRALDSYDSINRYLDSLRDRHVLPPPHADKTEQFLCTFLPLVIAAIGDFACTDKRLASKLGTVLERIGEIVTLFVDSPYDPLVMTTSSLLGPSLPFYVSTVPTGTRIPHPTSPYRVAVGKKFATAACFRKIDGLFACSDLPPAKFEVLLSAVTIVCGLNQNQVLYETIVGNAIHQFRRMVENLTVKTIREVDQGIFSKIYKSMTTMSENAHLDYVNEIFLTLNLRYVFCDILNKQVFGLQVLNIIASSETSCQRLKQLKFLN
jgi:hypothetical protein